MPQCHACMIFLVTVFGNDSLKIRLYGNCFRENGIVEHTKTYTNIELNFLFKFFFHHQQQQQQQI